MTLSQTLRELAGKATRGSIEAHEYVHRPFETKSDKVMLWYGFPDDNTAQYACIECVPRNEAELLAILRSHLPTILAALELQERVDAPETVEAVARAIAPQMEGGRKYDQMPPDRRALRDWARQAMCGTNDATQDDAKEAAIEAIQTLKGDQ